MRPDQHPGSGIHRLEIQPGISALPRKSLHERVFLPVYEVGIFPPHGIEACMKIRGRRNHL